MTAQIRQNLHIFRELHTVPVDESPTGLTFRLGAGIVVSTGLFFALISPFNAVTYLPFAARWVYWSVLIAITAASHVAVWRLAGAHRPKWLLALGVSLLATPLVLVVILVVQQAIHRPVPTHAWLSLTGSIWIINAALAALAARLLETQATPAPVSPTSQIDALDGLRQRLPVAVRQAPIWALCAQDHYLDVILADSHHLIHMRLGDAMALLAGHDGLQVHRSWWVARAGVGEISREGRRVHILLRNGQDVPVSRSGASRMRDANWL